MSSATADDLGKLLLRLTLGILILLHGVGKITGGVDGIRGMVEGVGLPGILAYGVLLGEVLGPLLLIIGWHGRVGAGLIAVNMLFAFGLAHRNELWQLNQQGAWQLELQGMFLFAALALVLMGPGRFSINRR